MYIYIYIWGMPIEFHIHPYIYIIYIYIHKFPKPKAKEMKYYLKHQRILIPLVQRPEICNKLLQVFCGSELLEAHLFRTSGEPCAQ